MGKSTDKTLRQLIHKKSKAQVDDMFNPADLDPEIAAYLRAKLAKTRRQIRREKIGDSGSGMPP